jgi:hypothetical protein
VLLLPALLSACSQQDKRICEAPPPDGDGGVSGCIHRAAYQFASAPGSNTDLARAVVAQCDSKILDRAMNMPVDLPPEAQDRLYQNSRKNAEEDAMRRIIQAKAGNCEKPS